jgi:hypothetical protein
MNNIYIIGYYDHKNLGDEQYKLTFTQILCYYFNYTNQPIFVDCDKIDQYSFRHTDLILLGGGDILNRYFLDKVKKVFEFRSNPIAAISVGLPYTDLLLDTKYLDFIDVIFVRTLQDIKIFQSYQKVHYIPDISYMLTSQTTQKFIGLKDINKKIIAISLSMHMYNPKYPEEYHNCLSSWIQLICILIQKGYAVIMIPFNTNHKSSFENDQLIQKQIYQNVPEHLRPFLINIQYTYTPEEILELYQYVYFSIPMRYHAVLFSIYKNVPMIPIYTTRKVKNVLLDCQWPLSYNMPKNEYDVPTCLDINHVICQIDKLVDNYSYYKTLLDQAQQSVFENHMYSSLVLLKDTISQIYPIQQPKKQIQPILDSYPKKLFDQVNQAFGVQDFRTIQDLNTRKLIAQYVGYFLTRGLIDSKYTYGLLEKMFQHDYDYEKEWNWVIEDHHELRIQHLYSNPRGWVNLNFIQNKSFHQDNPYQVHRSGWQYVYENLKPYHNNNASIFLDLYVDRTFHWNYEINKKLELIPYQQPWVGFVHHTFDTSFSPYNNISLLNKPEFIQSLKYCKGLIVLSNYQREIWIEELVKRQIKHTFNVYTLVHPTEDQVKQFSYSKFIEQKQPKLIHIGGWLRNVVAFYNLDLGIIDLYEKCCFSRELQLEKIAIKGRMMNNYFPPSEDLEILETGSLQCLQDSSDCLPNISRDNLRNNNWIKEFNQQISKILKSVSVFEHLSNEKYDNLLSENIVFIYLIDASAVNTLNECIVRNTPILINRHPAVVELLGEKYPLYFDTHYSSLFDLNQSIRNLFKNPKIIRKAHQYLTRLDKNPYRIQHFIHNLENIITECNH